MMKTYDGLSKADQALTKEMANAARDVLSAHCIAPRNDDGAARFDEACAVMLVGSRSATPLPSDSATAMAANSPLPDTSRGKLTSAAWHLFRVDAHDDDGQYVYIVSAESTSVLKAQELAVASVCDDSGTDSAPGRIDGVTVLGMTNSDIFQKIGPH